MAFYPVADIPDEARAECDNIAYELTGAVQNHSALIVLDRVSLRVLQVSNSISEILGVRPSELLSMEFSFTLLGSASPDVLPWPMLQEENSQEAIVRFLNRTGKRFLVRAHSLGNRILVSIEPESLAFDIHLNDADNSLADLLIRLGETESVEVAAGYWRSLYARRLDSIDRLSIALILSGMGKLLQSRWRIPSWSLFWVEVPCQRHSKVCPKTLHGGEAAACGRCSVCAIQNRTRIGSADRKVYEPFSLGH